MSLLVYRDHDVLADLCASRQISSAYFSSASVLIDICLHKHHAFKLFFHTNKCSIFDKISPTLSLASLPIDA